MTEKCWKVGRSVVKGGRIVGLGVLCGRAGNTEGGSWKMGFWEGLQPLQMIR